MGGGCKEKERRSPQAHKTLWFEGDGDRYREVGQQTLHNNSSILLNELSLHMVSELALPTILLSVGESSMGGEKVV